MVAGANEVKGGKRCTFVKFSLLFFFFFDGSRRNAWRQPFVSLNLHLFYFSLPVDDAAWRRHLPFFFLIYINIYFPVFFFARVVCVCGLFSLPPCTIFVPFCSTQFCWPRCRFVLYSSFLLIAPFHPSFFVPLCGRVRLIYIYIL